MMERIHNKAVMKCEHMRILVRGKRGLLRPETGQRQEGGIVKNHERHAGSRESELMGSEGSGC